MIASVTGASPAQASGLCVWLNRRSEIADRSVGAGPRLCHLPMACETCAGDKGTNHARAPKASSADVWCSLSSSCTGRSATVHLRGC